jgi:2-polyprenyl-6-methoxyphenol hydroxylase-like FAD-dependent oxidoreductase
MPQFNIVIIGGGIAGLGAAIALSRDGHKVTVYERRADTQEVSGSGLQIQPSAIKILRKWNLMDQFRKVAHESHAIKMTRYADGELIAEHKRVGPRGYVDWPVCYVGPNANAEIDNGTVCGIP